MTSRSTLDPPSKILADRTREQPLHSEFAPARMVLLTMCGAETFECQARLHGDWVEVTGCPEVMGAGAKSASFPVRRITRMEWL